MEVKYLMNVNEDALPYSIKKEFKKIFLEFRGGYNDTFSIIAENNKLSKLHLKGYLFENEDDEDTFVKLTNEKLSLFKKEYHKGCSEGYGIYNTFLNEMPFNDNDNKIRINRVFAGVHEKFNTLENHFIELDKNSFLCIKLHFFEFGVQVGSFLKCWDIILNNSYLFEEIFNKYYNTHLETKTIITETKTPRHENIFCNNGFVLFEHILNEYVKTNRGRLTDIHFFYWSMFNNSPQLIHQRPERFKEWFFENYNEDLGKIKKYDDIENPDKQKHYSNALDWFKLQNH